MKLGVVSRKTQVIIRPIGQMSSDPETSSYLSPNALVDKIFYDLLS